METPSLGCLHGEIEPKWHHVLSQAKTCSPGQGTLEQKIFWTAEHVYRDTPNKKYKNFHYLEGVSTELQDSFENTKSNFRSPSKQSTDTGTDKSNRKISKRFLHGEKKKKIYMISVKLTASVSFIYCYFIPVSLLA